MAAETLGAVIILGNKMLCNSVDTNRCKKLSVSKP